MDLHNANIWRLVRVVAATYKPLTTATIPKPSFGPGSFGLRSFPIGKGLAVPHLDEDEGKLPWPIKTYFHLNDEWSSFSDDIAMWPSAAAGAAAVEATYGKLIPKPDVEWGDPTTDAALWRWVTQGNCAQRLERGDEGFVVRCEERMRSLPVRAPFAPYGGDAYFDAAGKPVRIHLRGRDYKPGDAGWEAAKFAFRASSFVWVAFAEHAGRTHFGWANALASAVMGTLPTAHPLRLFLKPFYYRGAAMNELVSCLLLPNRCWAHRATGYTVDGFQEALSKGFGEWKVERFDDELRHRGVHPSQLPDPDMSPFGTEALAFWERIDAFVKDAFTSSPALQGVLTGDQGKATAAFWSALARGLNGGLRPLTMDELVNVLTIAIFNVTAFHWHVQGLSAFVRDPSFFAMRVLEGATMSDRQAHEKICMLTGVTGLPLPLISGDLSGHMPDSGARDAARRFGAALDTLQAEMDARNARRAQPYVLCSPKLVASSVGV